MNKKKLTHTDAAGKARMVNVGDKPDHARIARARGFIRLNPETVGLIRDNLVKKGDVLKVAEIAGIQAAKETPRLIPLCHPVLLTLVSVSATLSDEGVEVISECRCTGQTGVEMEALAAAGVALLTIYDMCKSADKSMVIEKIMLLEKRKEKPQSDAWSTQNDD